MSRSVGGPPPSPACRTARRAMLGAEPGELRGDLDTELSRHLASCPRCREAAGRIVASTAALDEWLNAPAAAPDVDCVLREAAEPAPRRHRLVAWAVPVAMAAGIAALLVFGPEGPPPQARVPAVGPSTSGASALDLEVPEGSDAAVFATADPDITVIWFLGGDR